MPRIVIRNIPRKRKREPEQSYQDSYTSRDRSKFGLDHTTLTLPNGRDSLITLVGRSNVILCGTKDDHILVILLDRFSSWYIDYDEDEERYARRDYDRIVDGLTKHNTSSKVANYYLMSDGDGSDLDLDLF